MSNDVQSIPDALDELRKAAAAYAAANRAAEDARNAYRDAAVAARRSGARVQSIADAAGISRGRANILVHGVRPVDAA